MGWPPDVCWATAGSRAATVRAQPGIGSGHAFEGRHADAGPVERRQERHRIGRFAERRHPRANRPATTQAAAVAATVAAISAGEPIVP